ncbi:DNA-directed RNA polymerase [Klebsiella phage Miami]|uniref:DNA-directed RNA polymerase n=1 Tax=Klebsiella phage Miami TaxID=2767581 RepID=A0A873WV96_9CAUD|nr:DNA-directed RNA polymerase [Klebsiella phage Miami]QPB09394.1 DNA-directed RNA polymerase [Klebsiella phage Miami]
MVEKFVYKKPTNQLKPELMSININLNSFPWSVSSSRQYMLGGNVAKAVSVQGASTRRNPTGFEPEYAKYARKVVAPSNMTVERTFYQRSLQPGSNLADDWAEIHVIFFNEEHQLYDLLTIPRFNTQNTYVGFEYKLNKDNLRKLSTESPTFKKGDVFAYSPNISDTGEWMFGTEAMVCGMTAPYTEEDGIAITESFARKLTSIFQHSRKFSWNEAEYVPLNLYGTLDSPRPFPENGESIRSDGIVMGFRRRDTSSALVGLTKKALMRPDQTYDILFYAPKDCVVKNISVKSDRYKNVSNNKRQEKITQPHTQLLERYEQRSNQMAFEVQEWYYRMDAKFKDSDLPFTHALQEFISKQLGDVTKNFATGKYNQVKRTHRNKALLDWNVEITLKERVTARKRFKITDTQGAKGVIVHIIPDANAPRYADGRRSEVIINNTPAFRRQIFSALIEAGVNLIGLEIENRIRVLVAQNGGYKKAYQELIKFYRSTAPEFADIVDAALPTEEEQFDHVDFVLSDKICVQRRSDTQLYGADILRLMRETYPDIKPQKAIYVNELGQEITTMFPVSISSMYYILLDKFGNDMSCQSFPKRNVYGLPSKLNHGDRYRDWHRAQPGRNMGEAESRQKNTQMGGEEVVRQLAAANSPYVCIMMTKRIIRANNPFRIKTIIKPEEYAMSRSLGMTMNLLNDAGYTLRKEKDSDLTS